MLIHRFYFFFIIGILVPVNVLSRVAAATDLDDEARSTLLLSPRFRVVRVFSAALTIRVAIRERFVRADTVAADIGWIKLRIGLRTAATIAPDDNRFLVMMFVLTNSSAMARRVRWLVAAIVFTASFGIGNLFFPGDEMVVFLTGDAIVFFVVGISRATTETTAADDRVWLWRADLGGDGVIGVAATATIEARPLSADFGDKIRFLFGRSDIVAGVVVADIMFVVAKLFDRLVLIVATKAGAATSASTGIVLNVFDWTTVCWFSFDDPADDAGELGVLWLFPFVVGDFAAMRGLIEGNVGDLVISIRFDRPGVIATKVDDAI